MKRNLTILAALLYLSLPAHSQSKLDFGLFGGMTAKLKTNNSGLLNDWGNGSTIGAFASFPLASPLSVRGEFSYSSLPYVGPRSFVNYPADGPVDWNASATPSSIYEFSLAVEARQRLGGVTPFIGLRGGVYDIHMGTITLTSAQPSQLPSGFTSSYDYYGTGVSSTEPFAGFEVGTGFNIVDNVRADVHVGYDATFDGKDAFIPFGITIGI